MEIKDWCALDDDPNTEKTPWGTEIYPKSVYDMLMEFKELYPDTPIIVTENGLGEYDKVENGEIHDQYRIDFLQGYVDWIKKAIDNGCDCRGYFVWSTMDVYSWINGYKKRYGLVYIDFDDNCKRIPKDSYHWYKKFINEKADITNPKNPEYEVANGSIRFENVDFRYNKTSEKPVLENINISIKSGETIGIMGGTGSAKSSFVNLLSRLYDVEKGRVIVGGKDVREYDLDVLRKEVSVVLQKNVLFSGTILENLRWGDENATDEECIRACKLACADEFIERMPDKYNTYIEQGGSNVSGGQKQRLCIARALLKKPKILILDDSTSAVDTVTDAKIRKAFREEIPDTTKIIIAQRISSVKDADRIIVFDDGKIDGVGTHEELLKNNSIYREVYNQQMNDNADFDKKGGEQ